MFKNTWWKVAYGVVCGLLGAGILFLVTRSPRGQPVQLLPAPTPVKLKVYVTGAVKAPGVYALMPGSRVEDAIKLAGGFLPEAEVQSLNLAAILEDGERVNVAGASDIPLAESQRSVEIGKAVNYPLDINLASQAELESLPEIGPVSAQDIIAYREKNGAFRSIDEIQNVPGIGPKTFEKIKELITTGQP